MEVILLDRDQKMINFFELFFRDFPEVTIVCDDFRHFMDTNEIDCVVSTANSYGLMDGGFDLAISEWFGWGLQDKVQDYILKHFKGEQPVGTSFIINTGVNSIKLIRTPTMRVPSVIKNPLVVYQCMRTTLITALDNNVKRVVIPAFGHRCGCVCNQSVAEMMLEAYKQVMNPPEKISWKYALCLE